MLVVGVVLFLNLDGLQQLLDMRKLRLLEFYNMRHARFSGGVQFLLDAVFSLGLPV